MDKEIIISFKTILFTFLIGLSGYVLYRLSDVFGILLISLIIVLAVEPLILYVKKQKFMNGPITRTTAVIFTYTLVVVVLIGILTIGIPPVLAQFKKMVIELSKFLSSLNIDGGADKFIAEAVTQLGTVSGGVISATLSLFNNLTTLFSLLIISIYISLDWPNLKERFYDLMPSPRVREKAESIVSQIEITIGSWTKGQLLLMFVIGVVSFFGLFILGVDYALALGLISGLLEFVPMIGPIISAILAGVVGFSISPLKGLGVIVLFTLIQQLENNILVPKIMQKVSGFSPIVILLALLVGSDFFGLMGAILAVPVMMIGYILIKVLLLDRTRN